MVTWRKLFRLKEPKAIESNSVTPLFQPYGKSGVQSYFGYPEEEYLQALRGSKRADVFDQMRRSDSNIVMCTSAVKNPIKSAVWEVEPYDDSKEAQDDAALVKHILFQSTDFTFEKFLSEALTLVEFGHAVFEVVHKPVLDDPEFGSFMGIRNLAWRSPRTLERWNIDKQTGQLISITQESYGDSDVRVDIPAQFCLVMSLNAEGSNYEGISLLRPAYGPWFRKNNYLKLNAIGVEKYAVPTPLVKVPQGQQTNEQYANLILALENYSSHESGYLTYPEGYEIDLKSNSYDPQKVETSIDNEDKRMTKAFLANFLELGMNSTGSYSLSNDLSDFFLSGLDHIANIISQTINKKLIPDLIQMNRPNRKRFPVLKHSGISDKAGKEIAEIVKMLTDGKYLTPSDSDEDHFRKRYNLPKRSDIGVRQPVASPPLPTQLSATPSLAERILRRRGGGV